jgi:hypothetical protein
MPAVAPIGSARLVKIDFKKLAQLPRADDSVSFLIRLEILCDPIDSLLNRVQVFKFGN